MGKSRGYPPAVVVHSQSVALETAWEVRRTDGYGSGRAVPESTGTVIGGVFFFGGGEFPRSDRELHLPALCISPAYRRRQVHPLVRLAALKMRLPYHLRWSLSLSCPPPPLSPCPVGDQCSLKHNVTADRHVPVQFMRSRTGYSHDAMLTHWCW